MVKLEGLYGIGPDTPELEHLRQGTIKGYESNWTLINAGEATEFEHDLEEVPENVDVLQSETVDGDFRKRTRQSRHLTTTFTYDPSSLAPGAGETTSVTLTGAELGDFALVAAPYDLQDLVVTAYVQAANTVEVRVENINATNPTDLASGTWRVMVIKPPDVTVDKQDSSETSGSGLRKLTVTNNTGAATYFKVRAR